MKALRTLTTTAAVVALAAGVTACGSDGSSSSASGGSTPTVTLMVGGLDKVIYLPAKHQCLQMDPGPDGSRIPAVTGNKIDLDTLRVTYLKSPEVDLMPRLVRFIQRSGIDIPDAELPPGEHSFRIEVSDTEGRTRSSILVLKVVP